MEAVGSPRPVDNCRPRTRSCPCGMLVWLYHTRPVSCSPKHHSSSDPASWGSGATTVTLRDTRSSRLNSPDLLLCSQIPHPLLEWRSRDSPWPGNPLFPERQSIPKLCCLEILLGVWEPRKSISRLSEMLLGTAIVNRPRSSD